MELKGNLIKKFIEENKRLRAYLFQVRKESNEEDQKYWELRAELALELNSKPKPLFTPQVNMHTVEEENDALRLLVEKQERRPDDKKRENEELRSMIYGTVHDLLEYK